LIFYFKYTKDFKWRTSINVGINRNKVLELPGASPGADGKNLLGKPIKSSEGASVNDFS
jgi:hypothetical protein